MKKNGLFNFLFGKRSSNENRERETERAYNTLLKNEEQDYNYKNYNYFDKDYNEKDQ